MGKYINGTFVPNEQDLLLQQQQKLAGIASAGRVQQANPQISAQDAAKAAAFAQAANHPAPATQPNQEVAEFAAAKQNYNMFAKQPKAVAETKTTPIQPAAPVNSAGTVRNTPSSGSQTSETPVIRNMDDLANAIGYTSPEEEERLRKASVANQRIVAVADALRQIGNIYNTTRYAPSQQFNSPVEMERQRYLQGKALRDKANQTYISYQQAKAKQEAQQREWDRNFDYKKDKDDRDFKFNAAKYASDLAEKQRQYDSNLAFNKDKQKATEARWERQDKESERAHRASEALRRQSNGIAAGSLNLRKQEFEYKKKNGGGSGSGTQPTALRGKNGWYSKRMNSEEAQAFYNQTYDEMKRRNLINEASVMAGLPADIFGQKSISLAAKKAAVDNALLQHPEVGDWLADEFEFDFDPRYEGSGTPFAPQPKQTFSPSYTPMLNGGRETIQGFGGGGFGGYSSSKEKIPGFGG